MSRNVKIVLSIGASLFVFCGLLCGLVVLLLPRAAQNVFSTNASKAQAVGKQIADYILPAGYQERGALDLGFEKMVMLEPQDHYGPVITLFQISSPYMSRDQLDRQFRQVFESSFSQGTAEFQKVGERTVTIKGEPAVLAISEGTTRGLTMRQATGTFKGKGGIALLMISGDATEWDWNVVEEFCRSIK